MCPSLNNHGFMAFNPGTIVNNHGTINNSSHLGISTINNDDDAVFLQADMTYIPVMAVSGLPGSVLLHFFDAIGFRFLLMLKSFS